MAKLKIKRFKLKENADVSSVPLREHMTYVHKDGKQDEDDQRNLLILPVLSCIQDVLPRYALIENVPQFNETTIKIDGQPVLIVDHIKSVLGNKYHVSINVIDTKNYSVPQTRQRAIILLTRKDQEVLWRLPEQEKQLVSVRDVIGNLPSLDPHVSDVLEEELRVEKLCGLTENEIRTRSHRPQDFYGVPHFMPEYTDGVLIARLNRVRCAVREAELYAVDAFSDRDGRLVRSDIIRALNRMSSMVYILMIEIKSGDEKWKSQPWRN